MMNNLKLEKIKLSIIQKPYSKLLFLWFLIFFSLNIYLNEIYVTGYSLLHSSLYITIPFISFLLINTTLTAISINLIIIKYREIKSLSSKNSILSTIGVFFAFLSGGCPGCVAGIFPTLVGIFGSTITLNSLPLYGFELQLIATILLLIGIYYLSKDLTCEIKKPKSKQKKKRKERK